VNAPAVMRLPTSLLLDLRSRFSHLLRCEALQVFRTFFIRAALTGWHTHLKMNFVTKERMNYWGWLGCIRLAKSRAQSSTT